MRGFGGRLDRGTLGDGIDRLSGPSRGIAIGPYQYLIQRGDDGTHVARLRLFGFRKPCCLYRPIDQMYVSHAPIPPQLLAQGKVTAALGHAKAASKAWQITPVR